MNFTPDSFQSTFNKLVQLSKAELKKCALYAALSILSFCFAFFTLTIAAILEIQLVPNIDQSHKFMIIAAACLGSCLIFCRLTRLSVLRLQTVIDPPANTFSFDTPAPFIQPENSSAPEVSQDRLPQTASTFYGMIEGTKASVLEAMDKTFKPVRDLKSVIASRPVLSLSIAFVVGNLIAPSGKKDTAKTNEAATARQGFVSSTIADLTMLGLSYGGKALIKELFSDKRPIERPQISPEERPSKATYAGQIIPFESRQKSRPF